VRKSELTREKQRLLWEGFYMKNNLTKKVAKKTAKVLDSFLSMDANSASCCIVYQPKAPKELERYRKTK
jgi:cyclic lactone autoinducer peptide